MPATFQSGAGYAGSILPRFQRRARGDASKSEMRLSPVSERPRMTPASGFEPTWPRSCEPEALQSIRQRPGGRPVRGLPAGRGGV